MAAYVGYRGTIWARFWLKVDTSAGSDACWPWIGAKSLKRAGTLRGVIWLKLASGGSRIVLAHRFALCLTLGGSDIADLMADYDARFEDGSKREAAHKCGNRLCCNPHPNHLYWATEEQNRIDRYGELERACA